MDALNTLVAHTADHDVQRDELLVRRQRLESIEMGYRTGEVTRLLEEVDQALDRLETRCFGCCEVCQGAIESDALQADPLRRVCLECLSSSERRVLEADLELAAEVQESLVPRGDVEVEGWRAYIHTTPFGAVSGDFADLVELPDQGVSYFAVGDVSGKGVSAALAAAHLQALLRSLAVGQGDLVERFERANRLFSAATPARVFATLVWGVVDRDGRGELVNAGHPPMVIVGHDGCRVMESTGVPVGLFPGARYSSSAFELAPGEQLVLYTDGVTESADDRDNEYGFTALRSLVSGDDLAVTPKQAAARYLADVVRHRAGRDQQDDLTLMILRRECCTEKIATVA